MNKIYGRLNQMPPSIFRCMSVHQKIVCCVRVDFFVASCHQTRIKPIQLALFFFFPGKRISMKLFLSLQANLAVAFIFSVINRLIWVLKKCVAIYVSPSDALCMPFTRAHLHTILLLFLLLVHLTHTICTKQIRGVLQSVCLFVRHLFKLLDISIRFMAAYMMEHTAFRSKRNENYQCEQNETMPGLSRLNLQKKRIQKMLRSKPIHQKISNSKLNTTSIATEEK